jgi:hypothetical protein
VYSLCLPHRANTPALRSKLSNSLYTSKPNKKEPFGPFNSFFDSLWTKLALPIKTATTATYEAHQPTKLFG